MKHFAVAVTAFLAGAAGLTLSKDANATDVGLCVGCTTSSQYENAARSLMPRNYNGDITYLIVNPDTGDSRWVDVNNVPPGQVPRSITPDRASKNNIRRLEPGEAALMGQAPVEMVFAEDLKNSISSSGFTRSYPLNAEDGAAVRDTVLATKDALYYRLPDHDYYRSFSQRNAEALAKQNLLTVNAHFPGFSVGGTFGRVLSALRQRLKGAAQTVTVCSIFNNGDISCSHPDPTNSSFENHIAGSAKTAQGDAIGGWGSGGGHSPSVNPNVGAPNWGYSLPGNTGGRGELWLFCGSVGGQVVWCYTQVM